MAERREEEETYSLSDVSPLLQVSVGEQRDDGTCDYDENTYSPLSTSLSTSFGENPKSEPKSLCKLIIIFYHK